MVLSLCPRHHYIQLLPVLHLVYHEHCGGVSWCSTQMLISVVLYEFIESFLRS